MENINEKPIYVGKYYPMNKCQIIGEKVEGKTKIFVCRLVGTDKTFEVTESAFAKSWKLEEC